MEKKKDGIIDNLNENEQRQWVNTDKIIKRYVLTNSSNKPTTDAELQ